MTSSPPPPTSSAEDKNSIFSSPSFVSSYDSRTTAVPAVAQISSTIKEIILSHHKDINGNDKNTKLSIMDFGCGSGLNTIELLPLSSHLSSIHAVDPSLPMLSSLNTKLTNISNRESMVPLTTHCVNLLSSPPPPFLAEYKNTFDIIVSRNVFHHIEDVNQCIKVLSSLLKTTHSLLIIVDYHKRVTPSSTVILSDNHKKSSYHVGGFTSEDIDRMVMEGGMAKKDVMVGSGEVEVEITVDEEGKEVERKGHGHHHHHHHGHGHGHHHGDHEDHHHHKEKDGHDHGHHDHHHHHHHKSENENEKETEADKNHAKDHDEDSEKNKAKGKTTTKMIKSIQHYFILQATRKE